MNEEYYRKANLVNCDPLYKSKVQFMTLGEMKKLHRDHGFNDDIKLNHDAIITVLKILRLKTITETEYDRLNDEFNIWYSENGCDREFTSDSDREQMLFDYISEKLGSDEWIVK